MTPVAALRLALRAMLADMFYPEAWKSRPWVEARLEEAAWSETLTEALRTLALRWGTHQGQEVLATLRQTLDGITETVAGDVPSRRVRRESTRAALDTFLRRNSMIAGNDVEDKRDVIDEDTMDALVGDPAYKELMIQYEQMKSPPYNTPPEKHEKALHVVLDGKITQATCPPDMYEVVGSKDTRYYVSLDGCSCPNGQKGQRTKYGCYHAVAVELYKRWQRELQPALFPKSLTVEERMAAGAPSMPVAPSPLAPMVEDGFTPEPAAVAPTAPVALAFPSVLTHAGAVMHEAPYSATVSVEDEDGYQMLLTVRRVDAAEFFESVNKMRAWCKRSGLKPHEKRRGGAGAAPSVQAPSPAAASTGAETPVCNYHGPMKPSDKVPGTFYCTKKLADGTYCKERSPK